MILFCIFLYFLPIIVYKITNDGKSFMIYFITIGITIAVAGFINDNWNEL